MSNETTPTSLFLIQARIDIKRPEMFLNTLKTAEMHILEILSEHELLIDTPHQSNRMKVKTASFAIPLTYEEDPTWFQFCFNPNEKSEQEAMAEFKSFASKTFDKQRNILTTKAYELTSVIEMIG